MIENDDVEKSEKVCMSGATPKVTDMQVVPVAGHDSMLLNLSGAHGPYFTRENRDPYQRTRGT